MRNLRVGLAQINVTVGDLKGNVARILDAVEQARAQEHTYTAPAGIHDGRLVDVYRKQYLPNYGVFDEDRYFAPGSACSVYEVAGVDVGVNICEDIWYPEGPAQAQAYAGAQVILTFSPSPFAAGNA